MHWLAVNTIRRVLVSGLLGCASQASAQDPAPLRHEVLLPSTGVAHAVSAQPDRGIALWGSLDGNHSGPDDRLAAQLSGGPQPTATIIVAAQPSQSTVGQDYEVFFETTSAAQTPGGSVAVNDDQGASCGPVALDAFGQGSCSLSSTVAGTRTLSAVFTPTDANLFLGSSDNQPHDVAAADTELSLALSPEPSPPNDPVTATVTLSVVAPGAGTPSGRVVINQAGSSDFCVVDLPSNQCQLPPGSPGSHAFNAVYEGDGNYSPSNTTAQHVVYDPFTTVRITTVVPEPSVVGQPVSVSFEIDAIDGVPTGTVAIGANTGESCAAMVADGSCALTFFVNGPHTLTASYSGDATHDPAQSTGVVHDVLDASTTLSITSHAPDPSIPNQSVAVDVVLAVQSPGAGTPHGAVYVSDGIDSCMIPEGNTGCQIALQTRGARTLTAEYNGDGDYTGSTAQVVHHVNRLPVVGQPAYAVAENAALNVGAAEGVLSGASDPDGDALGVVNPASVIASGIGGTVQMDAAGAFLYTPPANTTGVAVLDFLVGDGLEQVAAAASINVQPGLDLSVHIDDGLDFASGGSVVEYLIDVQNTGPADAVGATVRDTLPDNLVNASWTCSAPAGASCTPSGTGDIDDIVSVPSGSMLTYLLTATVNAIPEVAIDNTVVVTAPSGTLDTNAGNDADSDIDIVGIFANGYD